MQVLGLRLLERLASSDLANENTTGFANVMQVMCQTQCEIISGCQVVVTSGLRALRQYANNEYVLTNAGPLFTALLTSTSKQSTVRQAMHGSVRTLLIRHAPFVIMTQACVQC